jgi:ABC-type sugar transport system substrate-binding protein
VIADKIAGAGIPLIAIDIPHPHATYFGVDNYRAGLEAGELLASYAIDNLNDYLGEMVGEMREAGSPIIGNASHEVQEYGPRIIELALSMLQGRSVPPYNYINPKIITQEMVR